MTKTTVFNKDAYKKCACFNDVPEDTLFRSKNDFLIGSALGYDMTISNDDSYLQSFLEDYNKISSEDRVKYVAVWDFETTAQHNSFAVSLAIYLYNLETEEVEDTFYEIMNPKAQITKGAMDVHHITQEEAEEKESFDFYFPQIKAIFDKADMFVGQNLAFDLAVLERELERYNIPNTFATIPVFDTMKAGKGVVECFDKNGRIKAPTLEELCEHYGLEVEGDYHNAAVDVQQTLEAFRCLLLE